MYLTTRSLKRGCAGGLALAACGTSASGSPLTPSASKGSVVVGSKIVTISTDAMMEANEMRDGLGAHWPFLIDPERTVQRDLDIVEYTDPHHNPMIPHTVVLEPGLVIYAVYNGYWYWGRPSPAQLRTDLRAVTEKVRPDWDITAPGQRDAWERGDKSAFWPYGMSLQEVFAADPSAG